jgi:hypothetical protein
MMKYARSCGAWGAMVTIMVLAGPLLAGSRVHAIEKQLAAPPPAAAAHAALPPVAPPSQVFIIDAQGKVAYAGPLDSARLGQLEQAAREHNAAPASMLLAPRRSGGGPVNAPANTRAARAAHPKQHEKRAAAPADR